MSTKDTFGRPFVVRFRTTLDDYVAFRWIAQGRARWMALAFAYVVLAVTAFAVEYADKGRIESDAAVVKIAAIWVFAVAVGSVFGWKLWRWLIGRRFERDYLSKNDIEVFAGEMGLQVRGAGVRADYDWQLFERLKTTRRHIFLLFYKHGLIIPRRAFASPEEADAFVDFAKERLTAAKA